MNYDAHRRCDNCWDCGKDLATVVNGLIELQAELARSRPRDATPASTHGTVSTPPLIGIVLSESSY